MKSTKLVLFVIAIGLTCYIAYHSIRRNTLAPSKEDTTLIVGTADDYPPFSFNKDGKIVGLDIDLIKELGHRMTQKVEIKNLSFDALLLELERGTIQIIAAGLSPSKEREKKFFFTTPHISGDPFIALTLKNAPSASSIAQMQGKIVAVNDGYTVDNFMSKQKGINLRRLENVAQAILALKTGKIDIFVTAYSAIQPYLKQHNKEDFTLNTLEHESEGVALVVSKKHPKLFQRLEATLLELKEDGTIVDLKRKWGMND